MKKYLLIVVSLLAFIIEAAAQNSTKGVLAKVDSALSARYYRKGAIDTAYVVRPETKWTVRARLNVSGANIETKGTENGSPFKSEMEADKKTTLSVGVTYLGVSLNVALNPAKLMGKYHDYELNLNCYGRRYGFDVAYQDAKNFTGWYDQKGMGRITLPDGVLSVKTLNVNAFYVFNNRRFSYPAAFSQSYIQRRSAGSFLLAASGQGQNAKVDGEQMIKFKMTNIGLGAGYGYNFVPGKGWLLHISALPTLIVYSHTSMTVDNNRVPMHYHFPEAIITGRGAVVRQWGNKFIGLSSVYHFTNIGDEDDLAVHNTKWRVRAFFGLRL